MEIRLLRYFLTIAEEENISQAAKVLHITQPTLSRQLKELEETLGTRLFEREKKQMVLTDAGLMLRDRAKEILQMVERTKQDFDAQKKQLFSGHVAIGCVEADNSDTMAMLLEEFIREHPQVTFHIFSGTSDVVKERLDKGLIDIAILLEPVATDKYECIFLPRLETWGLLVEKCSFLAQKDRIVPEDLIGTPLITSARSDVQEMIADWVGVPFDSLNVTGTYSLIFNVFALVENQAGSAFTIEGATTYYISEKTKFIPLDPPITTHCVAVWKKNRIATPAVQAFIARFKETFN